MSAMPPNSGRPEAPRLDTDVMRLVARFWWPIERLGEGLEELARVAGLVREASDETLCAPPPDPADHGVGAVEDPHPRLTATGRGQLEGAVGTLERVGALYLKKADPPWGQREAPLAGAPSV